MSKKKKDSSKKDIEIKEELKVKKRSDKKEDSSKEKIKENKKVRKSNNSKISKKEKNKKFILIILLVVLIILAIYLSINYYKKAKKRKEVMSNIRENVTIEYGDKITSKDILKKKYKSCKFKPSLKSLKKVGNYKIKVIIDGDSYNSNISIKDTTPPTLEVKDISRYIDEEMPTSKDFVTTINDRSNVTFDDITIDKTPGEHMVSIVAKDEYGNKTEKQAKLVIMEDKEPPVISGLNTISVYTGVHPDLKKNVKAVDGRYGNVDFTVNDSLVNYDTPGTYDIHYTSSDKLGNKADSIRKIIIKQRDITYMINNFPTYNQFPNYPNGCEMVSLYNLLRYYGVNVSLESLYANLTKGERPHKEGNVMYGGNPEIEFLGDPKSKDGWGCYERPIVSLGNRYKAGLIDYTGHSFNDVLNLVKQNVPVQVWVSINMKNSYYSKSWINRQTGQTIRWQKNLHSVVIVGYNSTYVFVSDPYTGSIKKYSRAQTERIFNFFGRRAIHY